MSQEDKNEEISKIIRIVNWKLQLFQFYPQHVWFQISSRQTDRQIDTFHKLPCTKRELLRWQLNYLQNWHIDAGIYFCCDFTWRHSFTDIALHYAVFTLQINNRAANQANDQSLKTISSRKRIKSECFWMSEAISPFSTTTIYLSIHSVPSFSIKKNTNTILTLQHAFVCISQANCCQCPGARAKYSFSGFGSTRWVHTSQNTWWHHCVSFTFRHKAGQQIQLAYTLPLFYHCNTHHLTLIDIFNYMKTVTMRCIDLEKKLSSNILTTTQIPVRSAN